MEFDAGSHLRDDWIAGGSGPMHKQSLRKASRNDVLHLLPYEFVTTVSELLLRLNI